MKLSPHNQETLLIYIQQKIERYADDIASKIENGVSEDFLDYPPNGELSTVEIESLAKLKGDPVLKSALRKILASNSAGVLFELFNVIDGTADPDEDLGKWSGVALVDMTEDFEETYFLHEEFYDKYWDWRKIRPDKGWRLDSWEGRG